MEVEITRITCIVCKVSFWITTSHKNQLLKTKESFYCPNGHSQSYVGETDAQKLANAKYRLDKAEEEIKDIARSNSALRGVITRMRNKQCRSGK